MARTLEYWQNIIIEELASNGINVSGSRTSIRRIWTFVVAFCIYTIDMLFDLHQTEVSSLIAEQKPHSQRWYRNKALQFQYGHGLILDTDHYDNTGFTDEEIAASKIIKYSAVVESTLESRLIVKIVTEENGVLKPLTSDQLNAFKAYISEVKDGGVNVSITNYLPDRLYLYINIYYDPLILDSQGNSILTGGKPVEAAISAYLRELPFNGELVLLHLIDKLQAVNGVLIPDIINAETSWISAATNDYGAKEVINVKKIPESGYFEVQGFTNIKYFPNV